MLTVERQLKIAELVDKNGGIRTSELSSMFDVSEMTILRDLSFLEQQGILKRVYGGAIAAKNSTQELSSILRQEIHSEEKDKIAQKALKLISDGDSLFLDSSTTALALARRLSGKMNLTVVSNGFDVLNELKANPDIKLISPGGELNKTTYTFVGPHTDNMLREFFADKAFISVAGVSISAGLTVENQIQSHVKHIMLTNALQRIVLVDSSKFDLVKLSKVCNVGEIGTIVTDKKPPKEYLSYFKKHNIEIVF
jgi:DeoR/GlpR family transcriptional regulator of sugar metabolism